MRVELERSDEGWLDYHHDHFDSDGGEDDAEGVQYGALPDYDPDEDEEGPVHLQSAVGSSDHAERDLRHPNPRNRCGPTRW